MGAKQGLNAITTQRECKVHQIDVKSISLNGFIEEKNYVKQPFGDEKEGEEYKIFHGRKHCKN